MSEQELAPCPCCGQPGQDDGTFAYCEPCNLLLDIPNWNRLSRGGRLPAAVERITADSVELVYPHHVITLSCHYGLVNRWLVYTEQLATSEIVRSEVSYESLADALIANRVTE